MLHSQTVVMDCWHTVFRQTSVRDDDGDADGDNYINKKKARNAKKLKKN